MLDTPTTQFAHPVGRAPVVAGAMILGSCVSLQVGAALASRLFTQAGSNGTTLLRLGMAALVLLAVVRPNVRRWDRQQWRGVMLLGACMAPMNACFYAALGRIPLGAAVTIEFLGPLALAAILTRRPREWVWVGLALCGVAILGLGEGGAGTLDAVGVALAAVAGVFWALYILAARSVGSAVPGQSGVAVALAIGALLLVPVGAGGAMAAITDPGVAGIALATGVLASVIPYSLEMSALRRIPAHTFGVLLSIEPAIAAVAGWLLLGQGLGVLGAVGILIVVAASAGSTTSAATPSSQRDIRSSRDDAGIVTPAPAGA